MRFPARILRNLALCGLCASPGWASAQVTAQETGAAAATLDRNALHEFTERAEGRKLVARLLGVSADRRQMHFVREDGQEFETPITLFSLDDQQFVKDWLAAGGETSAPLPGASFRLELSISRNNGDTRKHREGSVTLEEKDSSYRLVVRNLSRETLVSARLDYAVVWEDAVAIYESSDGTWQYTARDRENERYLVKRVGVADLEDLRFNDSATVETESVPIGRVFFDGNELHREDATVGIRVRVVGADGAVLHESHSGGAEIGAMDWERIESLAEPRRIDR